MNEVCEKKRGETAIEPSQAKSLHKAIMIYSISKKLLPYSSPS